MTFRHIDPYRLYLASDLSIEACPGPGRCHGCVSWCDDCGDVGDVCNAIACDRHRCRRCHVINPQDERNDYDDNICKECDGITVRPE